MRRIGEIINRRCCQGKERWLGPRSCQKKKKKAHENWHAVEPRARKMRQ
ncbi:unnamed protein product [Sphacelaria rigidula]